MSETPVFVDEKKIVGKSSQLETVSSTLIAERTKQLRAQGYEQKTHNDIPPNYVPLRQTLRQTLEEEGVEIGKTEIDSKTLRKVLGKLFSENQQDRISLAHSLNVANHLRRSIEEIIPFQDDIFTKESNLYHSLWHKDLKDFRRYIRTSFDKILTCSVGIGGFHDLGKLLIPEKYRFNSADFSQYSKAEYLECLSLYRSHPRYSAGLVKDILPQFATEAIRLHHTYFNRIDGYPRLREHEHLPLAARWLGLVDSFCAIAEKRSYTSNTHQFQTRAEIMAEIRRCSSTQFDPDLASAFEKYYVDKVPAGELIFQTIEDLNY